LTATNQLSAKTTIDKIEECEMRKLDHSNAHRGNNNRDGALRRICPFVLFLPGIYRKKIFMVKNWTKNKTTKTKGRGA